MTEPPLPSAPLVDLGDGVVLQPPLSRCGRGPGLITFRPSVYGELRDSGTPGPESTEGDDSLDPEPLQKWAEEGYAVVQITLENHLSADASHIVARIKSGVAALESLPECISEGKYGLLVYGSFHNYGIEFDATLGSILARMANIGATVFFEYSDNIYLDKPMLIHLRGHDNGVTRDNMTVYSYPDVQSSDFVVPGQPGFKMSTAGVAHSRSLRFFKKHLDGPYFDLEKIWDEHTFYEFGDRSVEKTMATMVQEPYVNHIPTLTGGIGRARLSKFYLNHFIFNNPDDTALELISRTVGIDRVVDEFIFCFTHNKQIDWLIPGIPPTGKYLRIPFTAIVNIRGDRLYHEHIAWDQATVLVQLGLMPDYLPYPYPLPGGRSPAPGKRFEYRVPAAGMESAEKLENEHLVPSNQMFTYEIREVDDH